MRKINCFLLTVIFVFLVISVGAEEEKKEEAAPGMEIIQIRGSSFMVPKGALVSKKGDLVVIESGNEYVARRISEMEDRLVKIETKQQEFTQQIEQVNKVLSEIQQKGNATSVVKEK